MIRRPASLLAVLCLGIAAAHAAQPQFWKLEGAKDFLDGDTEGLSIDSEGRVRLAPAARAVHDTEAPSIWALAADGKDLFVATGNEGKVFRLRDGTPETVLDASELEVHAVEVGREGQVYAGSSPEGKVFVVGRDGGSSTFFDPTDKYIWDLALDARGRLLVATGSEGRVLRVDAKGASEVLLSGLENHITTLAVDAKGNIYAGSSPGGVLYRIDPAGKVFVLFDSPYREIKDLEVGPDGSVYAAAIEGKDKEDTGRALASFPSATTTSGTLTAGEVTVVESFTIAPSAAPSPAPSPRPLDSLRSAAVKGAVLRVLPSGEIDTLWSSTDEMPHALSAVAGGVLVGTGNKGKLYRVNDDRTWTMLATFTGEQVTALERSDGGTTYLATSNPGKVHALGASTARTGTFISKVKDTETVSTWGQLRWDGVVPAGGAIHLQSRSGNTGTPDATWTDWSPPYTRGAGEAITSEKARFLQVKAVLTGTGEGSPVLDVLTAAYLQKNLRPQVQSITVHPPGEIFQRPISLSGETEILGFDAPLTAEARGAAAPATRPSLPPPTTFSRKMFQKGMQTFSWKADDPNGDTLVYEVSYRAVGDSRLRLLKKAVPEPVLAWDTTAVPNGRYVVRVVGSDSPSNPEAMALFADRESAPFDVDNTPPAVTATLVSRSPLRARAVVRDDSSQVRRAEYSVDGGRWEEVHPVDGINDAREETYEIALGELTGPAPHVVVIRASDLLGNVATGRVDIP